MKYNLGSVAEEMVDISIEILASSVPVRSGCSCRYRIKTWWAHIDVPEDKTIVKLPRLPMIQQYLIMTGKDTTVFVETWQDEMGERSCDDNQKNRSTAGRPKFLGMTVCTVDEQLRNPNVNPSVQWLDVRNPVEDADKGKLLLKIDAKFALDSGIPGRTNSESKADFFSPFQPRLPLPPRRNLAANFPEVYTRHSTQSDASVISQNSVTSSKSQEQAVQTELSLPVDADASNFIPRYNDLVLQSNPENGPTSKKSMPSHSQGLLLARQSSSKSSVTSSSPTVMDPLQIAEDIINRHLAENGCGGLARLNNQVPSHQSSSNARRAFLSKQKHQQLPSSKIDSSHEKRVQNRNYDFESVEDVIDILNAKADTATSPPLPGDLGDRADDEHEITVIRRQIGRKPSSVESEHNLESTKGRLAPEGSSSLPKEIRGSGRPYIGYQTSYSKSSQQQQSSSSMDSNVKDGGPEDFQLEQRFKEVHFDGEKVQEHATAILLSRSSKGQEHVVSRPPLPVTRRRIAAAIFDDSKQ